MKRILVFLSLTLGFSSIFYYLIARSGSIQSWTLGMMWSPGVAALITKLIFDRSLRGLGWKPGKGRWLAAGYFIPLAYGLVVYGLVWLTGIGTFSLDGFIDQTAAMFALEVESPRTFALVSGLLLATLGIISSAIPALGEEIGWRGFLVPELTKVGSFTSASLISGVIWALWHAPAILLADYNNPGAPQWFGLLCFLVMVVGISFAFAWLRLKSNSLWPAVLLHASHNMFIQGFLTPMTGETSLTPWVIDEFGVGLALAGALLGFIFWKKRGQLQVAEQQKSDLAI